MEFYDVGTLVWILRTCVWWVPDFAVHRYEEQLRQLHAQMRDGHPFLAHSTRRLIEARPPTNEGPYPADATSTLPLFAHRGR